MDRAALARLIDHTLLAPTATPGQIAMLCAEATDLEVGAVCVSPSRLPLPAAALGEGIAVAAVVGFPSGAHTTSAKVAEAVGAVGAGAAELDLVIDLGLAEARQWGAVEVQVAAVRAAVPDDVVLKVIIEVAVLGSDRQIESACRAVEAGGADMVKTSTGFHPAGGATLHAVAVMASAVDGRLGVKAAGGIRDLDTALAMLDAGATRLGCSASRSILEALAPS